MSRAPFSFSPRRPVSLLAALTLTATALCATAQPLRFSGEVRVSEPRFGAMAEPARLLEITGSPGGFAALWVSEDRSVRSVVIDGEGKPDHASTAHLFEGGPNSFVLAAGATDAGLVLVWLQDSALMVAGTSLTGAFTQPVQVAAPADQAVFTRLVCGRSVCAIAFEIFSQPRQTRLAVVDAAAKVHSVSALPALRVVAGAPVDSGFFFLARDEAAGVFHALRVSLDGALRFDRRLDGGPAVHAAAASDGASMFVFWTQSGTLMAMRIAGDGTVSGPQSLGSAEGIPVAAVWNGTDFLVALEQTGSAVPEELPPSVIVGLRVSGSLIRVDSTPFPIATDAYSNSGLRLAWNGSRYFGGWQRTLGSFGGARALVGALLSPPGGTGRPAPLAVGPIRQDGPLVARASAQSVVAWHELDSVSGVTELRFARIAPGNVVVSSEIAAGGDAAFVAAAASGTDVLLVWNRCSSGSSCYPLVLEGLIVRPDGSQLRVTLSGLTRASAVALAGSRDGWLIAASEPGSHRMVTARISRAGIVSPLRAGTRDGAHAMAASDGSGFAVVSFASTISPACPMECVGLWISFYDSQGSLVREQKLPHDVGVGLTYHAGVYSVAMNNAGAQIVVARFDTAGRPLGSRPVFTMPAENAYRFVTGFRRVGSLLALIWSGSGSPQMATLLHPSGDFAGEIPFPYLVVSTGEDNRATAVGTRRLEIGQYAASRTLVSVEVETRGAGRARLTR